MRAAFERDDVMIRGSRKALIGSLVLSLAAVHGFSFAAESARARRFFDDERVLVVAHRGGIALGPEHTLSTFGRAVSLGVDVLEMDVRAAADGALVLMHDETVDRTTDGRGEVAALTLAEMRALDAGYRWSPDGGRTFPMRGKGLTIPTLEEVLSSFPGAPLVLELKSPERAGAESLCAMLRRFEAVERVIVAAFRTGPLASFRQLCPEVATAANVREVQRVWLIQRLFLPAFYKPPADAFLIPERFGGLRVLDRAFVERARAHGMNVQVWTVNEPPDVERLVALGVRGIITDDPERVLGALGRLPPRRAP